MKKNSIVAAIYSHPEAYPPTLNALMSLYEIADIDLLYRPHLDSKWIYPKNIHLCASGKSMSAKDQEASNIFTKLCFFIAFAYRLRRLVITKKPDVVVLYDSIPLLAYYIILATIRQPPFIWYHNHDVVEINKTRKYSIGWFAAKSEKKMFKNLDLFSLPALERKKYFPLSDLKGEFIFLPNLPNKKFYSQFCNVPKVNTDALRLIYQGSISEGHGLEEIINILPQKVNNKSLELHLAGRLSENYKRKLTKLIDEKNVASQVIFHGFIPYRDLPILTTFCDIGISIHEPREIIYQTGGTASNKIYEYVACGLPILYFENEHYSHHLKKYSWAVPTNLKKESLKTAIKYICDNYTSFSMQAKKDFEESLNFEKHFSIIKNHLVLSAFNDNIK